MKITKGQLRQIIREEILGEQAKTPKMPVTARDAVRQELLRQAKEMRQIQRRIEELKPHIEKLNAQLDELFAVSESYEEVLEAGFDSMSEEDAAQFVEQMEANLEAMDDVQEEIEPFSEELLALYDARRNVRGVAVSDIVRAQQP
jgi:DNA repair exonuclease SbcCD ATPase subunit